MLLRSPVVNAKGGLRSCELRQNTLKEGKAFQIEPPVVGTVNQWRQGVTIRYAPCTAWSVSRGFGCSSALEVTVHRVWIARCGRDRDI